MSRCGSGAVVCSWSLLIRWAQRARCQAETPLIALFRFPRPPLTKAATPQRTEGVLGHARRDPFKIEKLTLSDKRGKGKMRPHKFKVGDIVGLEPAVSRNVPGGVYVVIKHLPGNGEHEYRIKSANEPHERVARESELTKVQSVSVGRYSQHSPWRSHSR